MINIQKELIKPVSQLCDQQIMNYKTLNNYKTKL